MLSSSLYRLNIFCSCSECTTFLRPYPKTTPPPPPPNLHQPGASVPTLTSSLPTTPELTASPTPKSTPRSTAHSTPPTLTLDPISLFTRSSKPLPSPFSLATTRTPGSPTSVTVTDAAARAKERATLLTRTLWAGLGSPLPDIDDSLPPLSAKTPGLALCARTGCARKVVPGFAAVVCTACEEQIRGAVVGLLGNEGKAGGDGLGTGQSGGESKQGSKAGISPLGEVEDGGGDGEGQVEEGIEEAVVRFAVPSTPPSVRLMLAHSSAPRSTLTNDTPLRSAEPPLFALPNVSLDAETYEEVTPTRRYSSDFPSLPGSSCTSKTNSRDISTGIDASIPGAEV